MAAPLTAHSAVPFHLGLTEPEFDYGTVDTQLPTGAAGPHLDLEPAAPEDRAPRVRGLL
jgi:hypothetical protein